MKIEIRVESLRRRRYSMMCLGILYISGKLWFDLLVAWGRMDTYSIAFYSLDRK